MVKRLQVMVEALTGVKKVDLMVRPDPWALQIGLVMPYSRAQDHDVLKEPGRAFEQILDFYILSARIPAPNEPSEPRVNKPLRQIGHL